MVEHSQQPFEPFKVMCVLAHPDDESMAVGGMLARYAAEGVETYLVTATRGERGWFGPAADYPGPAALGRLREAELQAAAETLGLREVVFLDYHDGELDQAGPAEAIDKIVTHLRRVRPQVVVTFDPYGAYGHPDHIAISQFTGAAVVASADPAYGHQPAHRVAKFYYAVDDARTVAAFTATFGPLAMQVDGQERRLVGWPDWAITTRLDTSAYWQQVWQAITCHRSQLAAYEAFEQLSDEEHQALWGAQTFYRAWSLVNGGRAGENDLLAGLFQRHSNTPP